MSRSASLVLAVLLLGGCAAAVGIGLTILSNWLFRDQLGISRDQLGRLIILGLVVGSMPLGIAWARSRKGSRGVRDRDQDAAGSR